MLEFCYELPYEDLDFTDEETRKLYRIGRGEQGVLLVRPYTNDICAHWRFVDETLLATLLLRYTKCSLDLKPKETSLVWTWRGNSWRWVLRGRRYANHASGRKYDEVCNSDPKRRLEPMKVQGCRI